MAITYDVLNNRITDNNVNTEGTADDFDDLYNADKAGTLSIHARVGIVAIDGAAVLVDRALRPADFVMLGGACLDLYITVANWTVGMVNATIQVVGTDRCGNAVVENVAIIGNGNYFLTNWFATVTSTQVTVWNGGVGDSFDYDLIQGQWGVMWRFSANQYRVECRIRVSDGVTVTWLVDTDIQVTFTAFSVSANGQRLIEVMNNGNYRIGVVLNIANRVTNNGGQFLSESGRSFISFVTGLAGATVNIYSSSFIAPFNPRYVVADTDGGNLWNCDLDGTTVGGIGTMDLFNVTIVNTLQGLTFPAGVFDRIFIYACTNGGIYYFGAIASTTVRNVYLRNNTFAFRGLNITNDHYVIDADVDVWSFNWGLLGAGRIYRQYSCDATVRDRVTGALLNGVANLWDNVGGLVFSVPIVAGVIATQTVSHGYYDRINGNVEQQYGPFHLQILVPGYQTYDDYNLPLDEPTNLEIGLVRIIDLIFVDDRVALNLDEDNPESELFTQI